MARMPTSSAGPIAVTGATGYVASWVVHELLSRGATVHATVRDPTNGKRTAHLVEMAKTLPGELRLFAADLLKDGSFAQAFEGCSVVIHTASPFVIGNVSDPQRQLVDPALQGTRNVLQQVNSTDSVERVVLTSSVVAIFGDVVDCQTAGGVLTEAHWNSTSTLDHLPYSYSKTVAEREAWKIAEAQSRWRLVVINPGFVMGPSLPPGRRDGASVAFMLRMIDGTDRLGTFDQVFGWVDVRDVATAHAEAAIREDAEGRHILCAGELSLLEMGRIIEAELGDRVKVPLRALPKWLCYLAGPVKGFSMRLVARNVGYPLRFDTTRSRERLGITYRPLADTFVEHARELLDHPA
jgi:nucleoside-diphosphate-sugar epimerase